MGHRERISRYRETGGAADLVRVEVLVPPSARADVLKYAEQMRRVHRQRRAVVEPLLELAIRRYGSRVLDNVDLSRLDDMGARARVVGRALLERADASGFALGRRLLAAAGG